MRMINRVPIATRRHAEAQRIESQRQIEANAAIRRQKKAIAEEAARQVLLLQHRAATQQIHYHAAEATRLARKAQVHADKAGFWMKIAFIAATISTIAAIVGIVRMLIG